MTKLDEAANVAARALQIPNGTAKNRIADFPEAALDAILAALFDPGPVGADGTPTGKVLCRDGGTIARRVKEVIGQVDTERTQAQMAIDTARATALQAIRDRYECTIEQAVFVRDKLTASQLGGIVELIERGHDITAAETEVPELAALEKKLLPDKPPEPFEGGEARPGVNDNPGTVPQDFADAAAANSAALESMESDASGGGQESDA